MSDREVVCLGNRNQVAGEMSLRPVGMVIPGMYLDHLTPDEAQKIANSITYLPELWKRD